MCLVFRPTLVVKIKKTHQTNRDRSDGVCEQPPTRRRLGDFSYFKDMVLISKGSFGRVYRAVRLSDNMESDNMPTELGVLGSTVESASQL